MDPDFLRAQAAGEPRRDPEGRPRRTPPRLDAADFARAERIGEFLVLPEEAEPFAELSIDAEENRVVRAVLDGMLREMARR